MFAIKELTSIRARDKIYDLVENGKSKLEEFEKSLPEKYSTEFTTMFLYLEKVANGEHLPGTKYHKLQCNDIYTESELKSKHLRVYLFHLPGKGKVVVLWGYKNNQDNDLRTFQNLKTRALKDLL